ncbi:MAG: recombinase family protein [Bacteroidetes bacterium]|nr:recombinase family protein [Bacteroidota bacterium]
MKTADLYIRVSTDEQADKGYSQRNQEEMLQRYCQANQIAVRKVIFEDHSAKTFNRPEWTKLINYLKNHKQGSDLVLFTKWDRFSRNAPEAYQMINTLRRFGVEPQAIEQPLDMSVPENKMMLAIYLTAPEIENDRRSLNVFYGMRRAKKEGRWCCSAPIGYQNKTLEGGKKVIVFKEPAAAIMRWVFNELSLGHQPVEQVWKLALSKGLKCSKHNFWVAIRNPVYCGKILIPKLKDEESYVVDALHEPLIPESLFKEVQDALDGKKRKIVARVVTIDLLSLRGFVRCSNCTRMLTSSASKGRRGYYHYYHCSSACGYRQKAEILNDTFLQFLRDFQLSPAMAVLFREVLLDVYKKEIGNNKQAKKLWLEQINSFNTKLSKARELLLNGDIDSADYKEIKKESEEQIRTLEIRIAESCSEKLSIAEVERTLDAALENLTRLDEIYCNADAQERRHLIGSMFPDFFTFENLKDRTAKVSDVLQSIYLINKELYGKKNGTNDFSSHLSHRVIPLGFYVILLGTVKHVLRCLKSTFLNFKSKQGTILGTKYFDTI